MFTILWHMVWLSANLECRSEMRCTRLAANTADGGVLNITVAVWTAGFQCWRSGNIKRTQNVNEYMLVLALCLVNLSTRTATLLW